MPYREDFNQVQREVYWTMPRAFMWLALSLVLLYSIGFLTTGGDLAIYRFWAPKQENARRVVFENTQSYVEGKVEYLSRLEYQYKTAQTDASRDALRTMIISEASTVDNSKLPLELQGFIQNLKGDIR